MFKHTLLLYIVVAVALCGCGAGKKLAAERQTANRYFYEKKYDSAATAYQAIIRHYEEKNISAPVDVYASAGKSLYYSGKEDEGIELLNKATSTADYDDELTLTMKIKYYGRKDNHTKELDNLEKYQQMYRTGSEIQYVSIRLLKRYMQMNEYQKAQKAYEQIKEPEASEIELMELYHTALTKNGQKDNADLVAQKIFNADPTNFIGLNYTARKTFDHAETAYVAAIKEYEAKKTNAAYRTMIQKTKPLTEEFKKAKTLYLKLYNLYKRPVDAEILSRIFTRLNDKKNAAVYAKLAKSQK
ncbi:MAG: hypothetical protein J6V76_03870 [Bacteroidales bacterium]|nr:hypothetical protein [Bacteroidales bacterium]